MVQSNRIRLGRRALAGIAAAVSTITLIISAAKTFSAAGSLAPTPTPTSGRGGIADNLPPNKRAIFDAEEAWRLRALTGTPPPKNPSFVPSAVPPQPHIPAFPEHPAGAGRVVDSANPPFGYSRTFVFANYWEEETGDDRVAVYAGAERADPSQGVVVLVMTSISQGTGSSNLYRTTGNTGSLHVTGAEGRRVIITSTSGSEYIYDVDERTLLPR